MIEAVAWPRVANLYECIWNAVTFDDDPTTCLIAPGKRQPISNPACNNCGSLPNLIFCYRGELNREQYQWFTEDGILLCQNLPTSGVEGEAPLSSEDISASAVYFPFEPIQLRDWMDEYPDTSGCEFVTLSSDDAEDGAAIGYIPCTSLRRVPLMAFVIN